MAFIKSEPPVFRGDERPGERVDALAQYINKLAPELDFVLRNLGGGNLNGAGLTIVVRSADGKDELGSIGMIGGGVGLAAGAAAVTVRDGEIRLTAGQTCLRVTEDGIFKLSGGEWTPV